MSGLGRTTPRTVPWIACARERSVGGPLAKGLCAGLGDKDHICIAHTACD
jgi:hypothetical protein